MLWYVSRPQALEEEVEDLKSNLEEAESTNDELNLEMQELQEHMVARYLEEATYSRTVRTEMQWKKASGMVLPVFVK